MPHTRKRYCLEKLLRLAKLWPVVGLTGARQSGKTTVMISQAGVPRSLSLDDEDLRAEARASAKAFLEKRLPPLLIDEAQKAPSLFDAIKKKVDEKKVPGSYYLTGSTEFSRKAGIYESLTGRIGLLHLHPFTYAEAEQLPGVKWKVRLHSQKPRVPPEKLVQRAIRGGMPVPMFLRDEGQVRLYWESWLETSVYRDLYRIYGDGYDADLALKILREMAEAYRQGELPTLKHFSMDSRKLRKYLSSMEVIYLIRRVPLHPAGVGSDAWLLLDSGLCRYLMKTDHGPGPQISLLRHAVLNEVSAHSEYFAEKFRPFYYKSAKGAPVDWIDDEEKAAYKIIVEGRASSSSLSYHERSLAGAMNKLELTRGFLVCPVAQSDIPKKGIGLLPWSHWS